MELVLRAAAAADTRRVGGAIASLLRGGDVVVLTGELGAGKTTLVQGAAGELGAEGPVVSPTFTLVREYAGGRLPIAHADIYRLDRMQDVIDLALDELVGERGVLFIEWGDAVEGLLAPDRLTVELTEPDPASEARRIAIRGDGESWEGRWDRLAAAVRPWTAAA
jgi:tRNA threonylcarbamoyladenosine biosynthesis protein TsaE